MAVQWYPGHMHKAQKEIREIMDDIDVIIEVLDARIPYSSENPLISQLRKDKPCVKLLNKMDLSDPLLTQQWLQALEKEQGVKALPVTTKEPQTMASLSETCRQLYYDNHRQDRPIKTMIMGIPNVGKSSIINLLAGRNIAKVGNEPAVTKRQQIIYIDNGIVLLDTPGILWPRVENQNSGYRLAITGAVKDTAIEYEDIALYAGEYLLKNYPMLLQQRFDLDNLPDSPLMLLEEIGKRRGCLRSGGHIELHRASEILIHEYRSGKLGLITFETPEMVQQEEIMVLQQQAERLEKKALKQASRKKSRR
ncbi:MAG: ribosome biogenesis GTPase YlqF [Gammaproteobacteria bacterium CG22_combo_CG10-13_8_21_14_all_40_8]|nr:MAG: ribosome biogenesis GTPase YlqF [Gammaproteobacteria bacterium CG22_combo_CG10-13_8_21_14_all_40_8]